MPRAARRADHADNMQDQILGGDAGRKIAFHAHFHRLRALQQQRLRGEHVLHLAGADAKGQRAHATMRGGMRIAADDRGAGQREALFRPDDVHDALFARGRAEIANAEILNVLFQRGELLRALRILDRQALARRIQPRGGRHVVIGHGQRQFGPANLAPGDAQRLEGLRAGDFVDQVAIDEDQAGTILAPLDHVRVPDLLVQCAWGCHSTHLASASLAGKSAARFAMLNAWTNRRERLTYTHVSQTASVPHPYRARGYRFHGACEQCPLSGLGAGRRA